MGELSIDEQFAALPERLKVAMFRTLDVATELLERGDLPVADATFGELQHIAIPGPAKAMAKAAQGLLGELAHDEHRKRLAWARAEGFTGVEGLVAALTGGPFARPRPARAPVDEQPPAVEPTVQQFSSLPRLEQQLLVGVHLAAVSATSQDDKAVILTWLQAVAHSAAQQAQEFAELERLPDLLESVLLLVRGAHMRVDLQEGARDA